MLQVFTPPGLAKESVHGIVVDFYKLPVDADDTNAFVRAIAAGVPLFLQPRTYSVGAIASSATTGFFALRGVPGRSIIQRNSGGGGAFVSIANPVVEIEGVTFDMNSGAISANQWGVLIKSTVTQAVVVRNCVFKNNSGTIGAGLAHIGNNPTLVGSFDISNNEISNCSWQALYVGSAANGRVVGNYVHDCPGRGIGVQAYLTASSTNYASDILVADNTVASCNIGIVAGGIGPPYVYGTPSAMNVVVRGNRLRDITNYAVMCQGDYLDAIGNYAYQSTTSIPVYGAICYNGRYGKVIENTVNYVGSSWGIDIGGSVDVSVSKNRISVTSGNCLNAGGTTNCSVEQNYLYASGSSYAVTIYEVETDGNGVVLPYFCVGLTIKDNTIVMNGASSRGICLFDNPGGRSGASPTLIRDNRFSGSGGALDFYAITGFYGSKGISIRGNRWGGSYTTFINPNGNGDVVFSDVYDSISTFAGASAAVRSIVPVILNSYGLGGSILWVYPTAGGSGYTAGTTLTASGTGGGSGWTGTPLISQGVIVGVRTLTVGSGYSGTITVTANNPGGGSGATFQVVSIPQLPFDREITFITAGVQHVIARSGGVTSLFPTDYPVVLAVGGKLKLRARDSSTQWTIDSEPKPHFAVGSLPAAGASYNNAMVYVTGSTTGKWLARCNGSAWIWPDGTTVTT